MTKIDDFQVTFPFMSGIKTLSQEYIGIIQNSDEKIISFYDYESIISPAHKSLFLQLGEEWWWESNRKIPINIFMQGQMAQFKYCLKTIVNKEVEIMFGPVTSLNNIMTRRIKKRQIQLVRRID